MNAKVETMQLASLENPSPAAPDDTPAPENGAPGGPQSAQDAPESQPAADVATEAKERTLAERMAFLRRKEVVARRGELEARSKTEALEAKLKDLEARAAKADRVRELVGSNPLVALEELGVSEDGRKAVYEAMTREFIEAKSPYEAHQRLQMNQGLKALEDKIATLQKELGERDQAERQRGEARMAASALEEVASYIKADETALELTAARGRAGAETVLEVAKILAKDRRHAFKGNAEEFSAAIMKEAASRVESHFEAEAMKFASLKKMKAKLGIKDVPAELKTLTNALNGSPVVTKSVSSDDAIDEAVKAFRLAKRST